MMKCTISVGNSSYSKKTGWWWWRITVGRYTIEGDNFNYKTKRSAMQAAQRAAKTFGWTLKPVRQLGGDDDD